MKNFKYLLISLVLLLAATINAEELAYLNENGELTNLTDASTSVTSDLTSWNDGWYVVDESVTISDRIQVSGTVNLLLKNGVTLTAEKGITVGNDASLNIYAQSDKVSEMGALNATGERFTAGIGGGDGGSGGTIIINGGTVTVQGGSGAAGIGGGQNGVGGTITINGGTVTATGGGWAAGIGGGYNGSGGTIIINGGTVTAKGDWEGAGIGGGYNGSGGTIIINGGTVTATGDIFGAGIGGGCKGAGGTITIIGGKVTANGEHIGVGPGGFADASGSLILGWTNEDDFIYASSYSNVESIEFADGKTFYYEESENNVIAENADNIGGRTLRPYYGKNSLKYATVSGVQPYYFYTGNEINLTYKVTDFEGKELVEGTDFTATFTPSPVKDVGDYMLTIAAKDDGAYTGSKTISFTVGDGIPVTATTTEMTNGIYRVSSDITIDERIVIKGDVTLVLDEGKTLTASKGIEVSSGNKLFIEGMGSLNATGVYNTAGIGGGQNGAGGTITINGGTVTATGGNYGAGIGGGGYGSGGTITINGGTVTATGGERGAGIGRGDYGSGGTITINGGTVTATGGNEGAGIGGGKEGSGGTITINGGTVTATGGDYGAGIGGGVYGSGGTITINGGKVKANAGYYSVGVGSGYGAPASGSVTLGWTNEDDFIYASSYGVETIKFADGKSFYYEENGVITVVEGLENIGGKTLRPIYEKNSLKYAFVSGVKPYYLYTGDEIALTYKIMDIEGKELVEGKDYTATISSSPVKDAGDYILVITSKEDGVYTGSKTINFTVVDEIPVTATTTEMSNGIYRVSSDVTIDERIVVAGFVTLLLDEGKTLTASKGINVSSRNELTIKGMGMLNATGSDYNAGIGGGNGGSGGTININGGTVTATGGERGAGIGGGNCGSGGTITINGGIVTATGGYLAADIGGGRDGAGGTITINGGKVTANGEYVGVGSGRGAPANGSVTLGWTNEDDYVYASSYGVETIKFADGKSFYYEENDVITVVEGTDNIGGKTLRPIPIYEKNSLKYVIVSGIKPYYLYTGDEITLSYWVTDVEGKELVAGTDYIASLNNSPVNNEFSVEDMGDYTLTITAKKDGAYTDSKTINFSVLDYIPVTVSTFTMDGSYGYPYKVDKDVSVGKRINVIGDVTLILDEGMTLTASKGIEVSNENKLTINGKGMLNATGGSYTAGIGGGNGSSGGTIIINDGTVIATSPTNGAGIGGGYRGAGGTIIINDGTVTATSPTNGAGIGGGSNGAGGTIIINGGTVTATSPTNGAGIGGGSNGAGGTITINGGTVAAKGGNGAGIGGGSNGAGGTITINGGTVAAASGYGGGGIGGGSEGSGGTISINDGTVSATGGYRAAGIGGGDYNSGSTITINGGTVTATGGNEGAGIGGGYYGTGGTIIINGGKVTATAGNKGAGIGGGNGSSGGTISINGGTVSAMGGRDGAGIGSGSDAWPATTTTINISDGVKKIVASSTEAMCIGKGRDAEGSVVVNFKSNGNIVTGAAKDAIFYDSGEGKERQIRTKNLNHDVLLDDDVKEHISVNPSYAMVEETVTLTLDGAVDVTSLKVNDGSSDLALTDVGNGKWTFTMPKSDVTVSARIVPTYSVTLPKQMILHSASNVVDKFGKYQSGTVISFRVRSFWTESNVSDGRNALTPTDGIYSVTVGDADIVIDAEFIRNSNVDLADIDDGFTAIDGDIMTGTTGYTVQISDGASVTLEDATFSGGISCNGSATITLVGSNKTQGFDKRAGIWIDAWRKTLTIKGEGSLESTGGAYAAGIGCSLVAYQIDNLTVVNCGNVVIESGNITAKGGAYAAGIGMSAVSTQSNIYYMVGDITIKGGTVNAIAGSGASGIGLGKIPDEILNSGKKVTAVGKISIYDGIGKVNASSISETVTYMHGETDVSANKDAYFNIVVDGEKQSITPKSEPDYAIAIDKNMMGGTVICRKTARAGDKVVLNPVPARGYTFNSLSVKDEQGNDISGNNGSSTGDYVLIISVAGDEETEKEYSFVMPARDVIVGAEFVPTYEIVFDEGIKNGSVTADVVAPEPGDVVTLTAVPDEGYAFAAFSVKDGQGKTVKVNDNTFVMPASKAIVSAVFSPTYNIAIDGNMENGSVAANKTAAMAGEKVTLTATAASGYSLAYFTVKDDAGNDVAVSFNSFVMPEGPVTVSAVFVEGHVVYLDTLNSGYWAKDGDILKGTARCDGGVSHTVRIRSSGLHDTTTVTLWNVSLCGNIVAEGNAAIVLKGSNSVNAEQTNSAAIAIALDRKEFTLVIRGEGSLEAIGSTSNPGIGLESRFGNIEGGNLVIESGTITAKGGYGAAGIGTGIVRSRATLGDISIKGGAVTAIANNGYSSSSIQGIGIGEIESGTAQMSKIYLYHGLKVVNAYIKDMMQRYVVYMNGDGSEISGNVEEYFAYEGVGYDFFTKVRSLFNIGIDDNIANGTIAATVASSNGKAYADEIVTLTATPEFGYKVDFYTVKDAAGNNVEVNGNTFVMPLGDVTVSAKFVPKYAAITFSEGGKKATIDGAYGGTDALQIDENITVDNVVFNREFLKNTYSTMVLPFSVKTEKVSGLNAVLYYNGIGKDVNNNDAIRMKVLWAADGVINDDKGNPVFYKDTVMKANTPYLVLMNSETFAVEGPVTIVPTTEAVTKYPEWDWEFRGVWKYKKWDTGDRELGYAYGFAASAPENSKIKVGDFVKIGEGTYIYPLRAYLVSSNIPESTPPVQGVRANGAYAKRPTVAQKELPELMSVIIDDEGDGKQTTVIGQFNTRTGEFKMNNAAIKRTFDVKGRNVGNKANKARGAYYGKKVK